MHTLKIDAFTLTTALGAGLECHHLQSAASGLRENDFTRDELPTFIGRVAGLESVELPSTLQSFDCRNNRLAWLALQQDGFIEKVAAATERYGADRVAIVLGTSTSGILQTELAYQAVKDDDFAELPDWFNYDNTHETDSCSRFVAQALGITGPDWVISTACSSSAKVFATAQRLLAADVCDAVLVGGVDSLCEMTLFGFNALQLVSSDVCRPGDARRNGLSIGEAAGFALVELAAQKPHQESHQEPQQERHQEPHQDKAEFYVCGVGESADAYHMSSPHPQGEGAQLAMQHALQQAQLDPTQIDYINLHGTATPANDAAEDQAVTAVFGTQTPVSSTKGWTGHTLGAAGIVEIGLSMLALQHGYLPASLYCEQPDAELQANRLLEGQRLSDQTAGEEASQAAGKAQYALSNSFGFGGSNCSVVVQYQSRGTAA